MQKDKNRFIQFFVCTQIDVIGVKDELVEEKRSGIYVGEAAVSRLRKSGAEGDDPLVDYGCYLLSDSCTNAYVVSDEDWHPEKWWEFDVFGGPHCVKGSHGAKLPLRLEAHRWDERFFYIRANSIDTSADPRYSKILHSLTEDVFKTDIKIGIAGVMSHIKVDYLIFNLLTTEPVFSPDQIAVCEYLCASQNQADHDAAMRKFRQLGVNVFENYEDFAAWADLPTNLLQKKHGEE